MFVDDDADQKKPRPSPHDDKKREGWMERGEYRDEPDPDDDSRQFVRC